MRAFDPDSWDDCLWWFEDSPETIEVMGKQKRDILEWAQQKGKTVRESIEWFLQLEKARKWNREKGEKDFLATRRAAILDIQERENKVKAWLAEKGKRLENDPVYADYFNYQKEQIVLELLKAKISIPAIIRCTEIAPEEILQIRTKSEEEKLALGT
ncbi:hypothetical protein ACTID9_27145 [Brevibacillus fluminis]|uniref:hypothetical protein n=1 Tax=Brevibacillus fluminis TaxID=511487 RepID=UPI003F8A5D4C